MSSITSTKEKWVPHPYQERGIKLMLMQSAAGLLFDPGLGKTSVSLSSFKLLRKAGHVKWMLVIAPLRPVYEVWPQEIAKWENFEGLTHAVLHGKTKKIDAERDIYIINPEGLKWLLDGPAPPIKKLLARGPGMLVVDESTKFKDSQTQRFKLLKKWLDKFARRYILTGTFKPNTMEDLFGQTYIMDRGRSLGKYITHYRNQYFWAPNPIYEPYRYELQEGAYQRIIDKISPLVLQLGAEDNLEMPEMLFQNIYVTLPDKAMRVYADIENEYISALEEEGQFIVAGNAAVAGGKCRQIANGAVYTEGGMYTELHEEKLNALEELVESLQGSPLLVLYEFVHDLDRIRKRFPDLPYIGNGVSPKKTSEYLKDFNAGKIPVLAGHPASMGHGLNMQGACHHVCWFGITWNFEYYDQAIRRVYRQGQKNTVIVHHIVARGTLDETVLKVLGRKEREQKDLYKALVAPV